MNMSEEVKKTALIRLLIAQNALDADRDNAATVFQLADGITYFETRLR